MKKGILKLVLVLTLLIVCNSCVKEIIVPGENQEYWNRFIRNHTFSNIHTSGITDGDRFYTTVENDVAIFENFTDPPIMPYSPHPAFGNLPKPVMTEKITAMFSHFETDRKRLRFRYHNPRGGAYPIVSDWGETFTDYKFSLGNFFQEFGSFNDGQDRFVTAISKPNQLILGFQTYDTYLVYADLSHNGYQLSVVGTGYWNIPELLNSVRIVGSTVYYNNNFYAVCRDMTFVLLDDMSYNIIDNNFYPTSLFQYQGYVFSQSSGNPLAYTADMESWKFLDFDIIPTPHGWSDIEGHLFLHYMDGVYYIENVLGNMRLYGLPKANMKGTTITSVNKFKGDLVVTTLNGIYYKSFNQVLQDKEFISPVARGNTFYIGE